MTSLSEGLEEHKTVGSRGRVRLEDTRAAAGLKERGRLGAVGSRGGASGGYDGELEQSRADERGVKGGRGYQGPRARIGGSGRVCPPNPVPAPLRWPSTIPPLHNASRHRFCLTMASGFANLSLDRQRSTIAADNL